MPLDESLAYYWTSLGMSAVAVVVFLWLLVPPKRRKGTSPEPPLAPARGGEGKGEGESSVPVGSSRLDR